MLFAAAPPAPERWSYGHEPERPPAARIRAIRMPDELWRRLGWAARQEGMSRAAFVRVAVDERLLRLGYPQRPPRRSGAWPPPLRQFACPAPDCLYGGFSPLLRCPEHGPLVEV